ncbi:MAG: ribonuclease Z, partial [Chloroflexi bacterium]|nr:ribonuclease Z [Chloroflexota bacterium]
MAKVVILGSSNAISHKGHENTHMVIVGETRTVLVDCVSNPLMRLEQAGVDFNTITDIIVTHFHPDHVSGVPLLLMDMWLMGRRGAVNICGLHHTIDRLETLMGLYSWDKWPDFFPVSFTRLPASEMILALDCPEFRIYSSPVQHLIPTIGLR